MHEACSETRFTVVIPAFNAARTLRSAMNSVLTQTVADLEVIVVDDGSADETRAVAAGIEDPRVRVIHQANCGLSAARNAGTGLAAGSVTCYVDSDDLLAPTYLEAVERAFDDHPGADFVYSDTWTFDDRSRRIRRTSTAHYQDAPTPAPPTASALFRELLRTNFMPIPVAARTGVIKAAGGFDETLTSAEDWDLWLRLAATGHRAAQASGLLGLRRVHPDQMSLHGVRMVENDVRVLEKLIADFPLAAADRRATAERLERMRRELRIIRGEDHLRSPITATRYRLATWRRRHGLDRDWYHLPPDAVTSAFPDLETI